MWAHAYMWSACGVVVWASLPGASDCKLPWELNLGLLQEQYTLLTAEPFLQPLTYSWCLLILNT